MNLAPGHILQFYHLKNRLKALPKNATFIEFGAGNGMITSILLECGFSGVSFDLNKSACENNIRENRKYIDSGRLEVRNTDFIKSDNIEKVDFVISSHVIEHMGDDLIKDCFAKIKSVLKENGKCITLVPSSMDDWGVEDDIAGHKRRYTFDSVKELSNIVDLKLTHMRGLTFPLSNFLLPIGNYLIAKNESHKHSLNELEQTIESGNRNNKWKTSFPNFMKIFINPIVLSPFILLQYLFRNHKRSLCIYFELSR